jgi:hypothetical protein
VNERDKTIQKATGIRTSRAQVRKAALIETAAQLLWEDELTDQQIAEQLGVHRATLARWKHRPDFQAERLAHVEAYEVQIATQPRMPEGFVQGPGGQDTRETRHFATPLRAREAGHR